MRGMRSRELRQTMAMKLAIKMHSLGARIHGWIERDRRGNCPTCGGVLTEQKKGWYRCDRCRFH